MRETLKEVGQMSLTMWRAASGALLAWKLFLILVGLIVGGTGLIAYKAGQASVLGEADLRVAQIETEYKDKLRVLEDNLSHLTVLLDACKSRIETTDKALKQSQGEVEAARKEYVTASRQNTELDKRKLCKRLDTIGYRCR